MQGFMLLSSPIIRFGNAMSLLSHHTILLLRQRIMSFVLTDLLFERAWSIPYTLTTLSRQMETTFWIDLMLCLRRRVLCISYLSE